MDDFHWNGFGKNELKANSEDPESRYLPRWKVRNRVRFAIKGAPSGIEECETIDLSCSGVCVRSPYLLVPGQTLHMKIFLDDEKAVEVDGHVVWNRVAEDGRYAGVNFNRAPVDVQEEILNYAFEINPNELVKYWFSGWKADSQK